MIFSLAKGVITFAD